MQINFYRHANLGFTTLPHATSRDIEFCGHLIPKGTTVLGDLDSVMNDREQWNDPEVFRPQRFIDESGSLKTPEHFIPFSLGRCWFASSIKLNIGSLISIDKCR